MYASQIEEMAKGYIEAALFTAPDYAELGMVETSGEFDASPYLPRFSLRVRTEVLAECTAFYNANAADLADYPARAAGHDLSYTRNGHGCGFWEADHCTEEQGKRLSEAARELGERHLWRDRGWFKFE